MVCFPTGCQGFEYYHSFVPQTDQEALIKKLGTTPRQYV